MRCFFGRVLIPPPGCANYVVRSSREVKQSCYRGQLLYDKVLPEKAALLVFCTHARRAEMSLVSFVFVFLFFLVSMYGGFSRKKADFDIMVRVMMPHTLFRLFSSVCVFPADTRSCATNEH